MAFPPKQYRQLCEIFLLQAGTKDFRGSHQQEKENKSHVLARDKEVALPGSWEDQKLCRMHCFTYSDTEDAQGL